MSPTTERSARRSLASFDSATGMVRALAHYLHGRDFPALGLLPRPVAHALEPLAPAVNRLPLRVRERLYALGGRREAVPPGRLGRVSGEAAARWVVGRYPRRRYQAVALGSASGALVHLCAASGIPFLPQTLLIPVRHPGVHPDEPRDGLEAGREPARRLLDANPELELHHMHDPSQDRLMIAGMSYFRVKRTELGDAYRSFLEETLPPGGTVLVADCRLRWPTTAVADRHVFQFGALGGARPEEFFEGSERVARYLERYGSHRSRWEPPPPDAVRPEAEWGFEPALLDDVAERAERHGWRVRRLSFEDPEHLSPLVADLYRRWYGARGLPARRLMVGCFLLVEPWWTLRTGSVPFWLKFPVEPAADALDTFLEGSEPYDEVHAMLFSHGVESIGLAPIERWQEVLSRAGRRSSLLGVDPARFPADFATFLRYQPALRRLPPRYAMPGPLRMEEVEAFVGEAGGGYRVALDDGRSGAPSRG